MDFNALKPQVDVGSYWPRPLQLAVAVPSLLIWTLLVGQALLWFVGAAVTATTGMITWTDDWRFPYLLIMLILTLFSSGVTSRTLWLAYRGRSRLWWHAFSFGLGMIFLGIVGD